MTSISVLKFSRQCAIAMVLSILAIGLPLTGQAQSGISMTVAPTLVELNMEPGEVWRSSVKVINTNTFPLRIAATPAHFAATGERGQGNAIPVDQVPTDEPLLVNWVTVETSQLKIPPGQSRSVPFVIEAPADASPGSHFAALQISTRPPENAPETSLRTAQVISSLLFVRVAGAIDEAGQIRSFTTTNSFGTEPETEMTLRFENSGNVHVRPVGEIVIRNLWGTERGRIPVNYNTSFGNALPETIREYNFAWSKEPSLLDIGYYSAEVSLAYGVEARQFDTARSGFWVVPIKPLLILLATIFGIIAFIVFVSRWYISQLLAQAGVTSLDTLRENSRSGMVSARTRKHDLDLATGAGSATADLPTNRSRRTQLGPRLIALGQRTLARGREVWSLMGPSARRGLVLIVGLLIISVVVTIAFVRGNYDPGYQATVGYADQAVTYNAEEIAFFQQPGMTPRTLQSDAAYEVVLVNTSKSVGAAGRLAADLVAEHPVVSLQANPEQSRERTVILFPASLQAEASLLSEALGGALLSTVTVPTSTIRVYIGADTTW